MKKLLAILMALVMVLALAACGESGPPDPNCGVYTGDTVVAFGMTMNAADVLGQDFSLELQSGGKAILRYDGSTQRLKWTLTGTAFHAEGGGDSLDGTLADGVLTIPDFGGTGMEVTFVNHAYTAPAPVALPGVEPQTPEIPETPETPETPAEPEIPAGPADWWNGKWYGWAVIYEGGGDYEEDADTGWDVCAEFQMEGETGHMILYAIGADPDNLTGEADLLWLEGGADHGRLISTEGYFLFDEVEEGEWYIGRRDSPVAGIRDMISIYGQCEADEDGNWFTYYIFLRPWGMTWDDVASADTTGMPYPNMMPFHYEDWYLEQLAGGASAAPETPAAEPEPAAGEEPVEAPVLQAPDPADKEGADGEVDMDTLRRALPWLKTDRSYSTTYEEVAALFGVHGQWVESPFEGKTIYRWWSGDAYIQVTFDLHEDGSETWNVTQYDGFD